MSAIKDLKKLLNSQVKKEIISGNWQSCRYEIEKEPDGSVIELPEIEIGFSFDKRGRFQGIHNWKE